MAFRIKDLVISVVPGNTGCIGTVPDPCNALSGCAVSVCAAPGSLVAGCQGEGCTNSCDAGCSRVQCSDFKSLGLQLELADLQAAELVILRAQLRVAMAGQIQPAAAQPPQTPEDMDRLQKQLEGALEALSQQRDNLNKKK